MDFLSGAKSCKDGQVVSSYTSLPGITLASGSLSGTGATVATAYDATGKVIDFTLPVIRITSGGITAEAAATNLILQSQAMTTTPWGNFNDTVTPNAAVAPDGTNTAATILNTGDFPTLTSGTVAVAGVHTVTISGFCGPGATNPSNSCQLRAIDPTDTGFSTAYGIITITPPVTGHPGSCSILVPPGFHYTNTSGSAVYLPYKGYCRASVTFNTISTTNQIAAQIWGTGAAQCGAGCLNTVLNVWGAAIQLGPLTSYLPTTTAAVTRSADTATQPFHAGTAKYATIYFAPNQSYSYPAMPASPLDLTALPTGGQPISEALISYTEPEPGAAVGAGYNTLTFQTPAFTTKNVDFTLSCPKGGTWYFYNFGGTVPTAHNTTVSNGVLTAGASGNNYNATVSTVCGLGGQAWRGVAFGGGFYAEATFHFAPGAFDYSLGWPAWWMESLEAQTGLPGLLWPGAIQTPYPGYMHFSEIDVMEYFGGDFSEDLNTFETTLIDWYGASFGTIQSVFGNLPVTQPASGFNNEHKYSVLWVEATPTSEGSATYYLDHVLVFKKTWSILTAADQPPPTGQPWAYGVTDLNPVVGPNHYMLVLGSGATAGSGNNTPIIVSDVKIWQASTASNLYH